MGIAGRVPTTVGQVSDLPDPETSGSQEMPALDTIHDIRALREVVTGRSETCLTSKAHSAPAVGITRINCVGRSILSRSLLTSAATRFMGRIEERGIACRAASCGLFFLLCLSAASLQAQQSFVYTNFQSATPIAAFTPIQVITNIPPGSNAFIFNTITAPDSLAGHHFTHWTVNNVRIEDTVGRSLNPVQIVLHSNNVDSVAHYLSDTNFTGDTIVPDWYKVRFYNGTTNNAGSDTDGDGFDLGTEYRRGYHPRLPDQIVEGGSSLRVSAPIFVGFDTNRVTVNEQSDPRGVFADKSTNVVRGTNYTVAIPVSNDFIGWFVDGNRLDTPFSIGSISRPVTNSSTTFIAKYILGGADTDADGLPDAYEMRNFNTLTNTPTNDPDGDGFDIGTEYARGYHPGAFDEIIEGGNSLRLSASIFVNIDTNLIVVNEQTDPRGVLPDKSTNVVRGTNYTVTIPTSADFIGWFVGGDRLDTPFSIGSIGHVVTNDPTTFIAKYILGGADTDSDGLPDAYEMRNFNTITNSPNSDPDGDGFDIATEQARGYHPSAFDEIIGGGNSLRLSALLQFVPGPPDFAQQPAGVTNLQGTNVTLSVTPHGVGPFTFQWRLNGVNLTNATNAILTLTNAYPTNGGAFSVVLQSPFGASNGQPALVVVETGLPDFNLAMADNFTNAPLVTNDCRIIRASNEGATFESGEPIHADKPVGKSVWLKWRASADGIVRLGTRGSSFDTVLAVYDGGPDIRQISEVVSDDDSGGFYTSELVFGATQGREYWIAVDGLGGFTGNIILSWCLEVTHDDVPRFTEHPAGRTAAHGARVPLVSRVVTRGTPQFQWYKNGEEIAGAVRNKLVLENVQPPDAGVYRVAAWVGVRTNFSQPADIQISSRVTLVVKDKLPELLKAPGAGGGGASFEGGIGSGRNRLQTAALPSPRTNATVNAIPIAIGTPDTHIFDNFSSRTDAGEFPYGGRIWYATDHMERQPATNGFLLVETRSDTPVLAIAVTELLSDDYRVTGQTWFMTNSGPGHARLTVPVKGGTNYFITWATAQREPARFTNNILLLDGAIRIAQHPENAALPPAGSATLRVVAGYGDTNAIPTVNGIGDNFSYQWLKDGAAVGGATSPTLGVSQTGTYAVVVSNALSSVTSSNAVVGGATPLAITNQPAGVSTSLNALISLSVGVDGSRPVQYQWRRNGLSIPGARGSIHTLDPVEASLLGNYDVIASNALGSITSVVAVVSVDGPISITRQPADVSLPAGGNHVIQIQAAGTPPLFVQWLKEGQVIPAATNFNLALENLNRSHSGRYHAVVTNATEQTASSNAVVRVLMPARLQSFSRENNGLFRLLFLDYDGRLLPANLVTAFVVEASSDLLSWSNLTTNSAGLIFTNGEFFFEDTNALNYSRRYYRVLER